MVRRPFVDTRYGSCRKQQETTEGPLSTGKSPPNSNVVLCALADLAAAFAGRPVLAVVAVILKVLLETAVILGNVGRRAGLKRK